MGGLRLDSPKALAGGLSGKVILPGKSAESLLVKMIGGLIEGKRMPMTGDPLTDEQIGLIRRWIDDGASWPEDSVATAQPEKKHWAYVPPVRPSLPEVKNKSWARNPIDLFVLSRLEKEGLQPSPETDRARLIRRVSRTHWPSSVDRRLWMLFAPARIRTPCWSTVSAPESHGERW
jgi:hypothetical protein